MTSHSPVSDSNPRFFADSEGDDRSSHAHRQFIGYLGLVLTPLLLVISGWRPTEGLERWGLLDSVSAYYYTGAVAVFVGTLTAIAAFFFTYRGYGNESYLRDRAAAMIAGVAAVAVGYFPTVAPYPLTPPSWWTPGIGKAHYVAAVFLFGSFIYFALFLFPKVNEGKKDQPKSTGKKVRNSFYYLCGVAMLLCIVWAGIAALNDAPIFWAEAGALFFFAVSWLVKGRADRTAIAAVHYGRHPAQLADKVSGAIRGLVQGVGPVQGVDPKK
jgi:hypothetical protein